MKEAMFWEEKEGDKVQCHLCPHECLIKEGGKGLCNVRENQRGKLNSLVYGKAASLAVDPIEKKPLYHFHPGSKVLSYGTIGCNLSCSFCQNASLSCGDPESPYLKERSVEEMVREIKRHDGIAWTYNEPTISYEFSYDVFKKLKEDSDRYTVYVTNGYIQQEPLRDIIPHLDAMNIDIKAFTDEFYRDIAGGTLQPVLDTAETAVSEGVHVEVTYLIIPGHNDSKKELHRFSSWVKDKLGEDTVIHFSRFHPDHKMRDTPSTPTDKMKEARKIAEKVGMNFVYIGNMRANNDTRCPECDTTILSRSYFSAGKLNLEEGNCPNCGRKIPIVT